MQFMTNADLQTDFDIASFREPTIAELLADPLTRALMKADHVDAEDLERRFRARIATTRSVVNFKPAASAANGARARSAPSAFARARGAACGSLCPW